MPGHGAEGDPEGAAPLPRQPRPRRHRGRESGSPAGARKPRQGLEGTRQRLLAFPGRRRPLPAAGAGFLGVTPTRVTHERQRVFALDTNIFIYHFEENPAYVGFTQRLFERIESGRVKAVTSALTLHEVLTGARKAGDDRLFSLYRDLIGSFLHLQSLAVR